MAGAVEITVRLTLLSDMCCGTGESGGKQADILTATDDHGLPIIPGKRLKNLLRSSAEIVAFDRQRHLISGLFGEPGGESRGRLRFAKAELVGAKDIKDYIIEKRATPEPIEPQQATDAFTRIRNNTAIAPTGIAQEHSLRSLQVVNRSNADGVPTVFQFRISADDLSQEEVLLIENSVKALRHVGLSKSRGLGEIICEATIETVERPQPQQRPGTEADEGTITVSYRINLLQDVVLSGGSGEALDYFPGSMLQGAFARYTADAAALSEHVLNNTRFGNAYINIGTTEGSTPAKPMPFSMVKEKNIDVRGEVYPIYDLAYGDAPKAQYVPISGYYFEEGNKLYNRKIQTGFSFHNSRPTTAQGKQFYSLRQILAGQSFSGTISASRKAIEHFRMVLEERRNQFVFGSSGNGGYGLCELVLDTGEENRAPLKLATLSDSVIVEFVSDVIFIDEFGNNSVDIQALLAYLLANESLGFTFDQARGKCFTKTTTVGGYNSHWQLPKRQFAAFRKGSILVLEGCRSAPGRAVNKNQWFGYLQNEGYGQITIHNNELGQCKVLTCEQDGEVANNEPVQGDAFVMSPSVEAFVRALSYSKARLAVQRAALKEANAGGLGNAQKSMISRLLNTYQSAVKAVNDDALVNTFKAIAIDNLIGDDEDEGMTRGALDIIIGSYQSEIDKHEAGAGVAFSAREKDRLFEEFILGYLKSARVSGNGRG